MQGTGSADELLSAVKGLARPDAQGRKSVGVSVVSSFTGLSNSEITDLVLKLEKFEASIQLNDEGQTISFGQNPVSDAA
jgi:hypothetical protein